MRDNEQQFSFWVDKDDMAWLSSLAAKFPFRVTASELIRQLIKEKRAKVEGIEAPLFFSYVEGPYRG